MLQRLTLVHSLMSHFSKKVRRPFLSLACLICIVSLGIVSPGLVSLFNTHQVHAAIPANTFTGITLEGFTGGGLTGQYYPNTNLSGSPTFTRQDVRLDFTWGTNLGVDSISGSHSLPFPTNQFSVKWTGHLLPRYSETYTFTTVADDGIRVIINGQHIIDNWNDHSALATDTGTVNLTAGQSYDVEIDYYQKDGGAQAQLFWSSPSTPQQIIETAVPLGIDIDAPLDFSGDNAFTDVIKVTRQWTNADNTQTPMDSNGWPTQDTHILLWDHYDMEGTYQLYFTGQAGTVSFGGPGLDYTLSPVSYDAGTNTSTATLTIKSAPYPVSLYLQDTKRTPSSPVNSGVTNVKLLRPLTKGSSTSYDPSTTFSNDFKNFLSRFTAIRFMDYLATNWNEQKNWSDRNTPFWYSQAIKQHPNVQTGWEGIGGAWEYAVQLCNETGKDAYINIPALATNDYITNIANLFKYGSDGVNPYTSPQANPVFPPLNPNLRVYMEYGNEYWNPGFSQLMETHDAAVSAVQNNTPNGQILSFDGTTDQWQLTQRYQALRIKQTSDVFRSVWGDSAMNTRIRVLYEWQYGGGWGSLGLQFLDTYFNNGDGQQHVADPHPVNYFIWGGGGGWYDNPNDANGTGSVTVPDNSFETPQVSGSQQNPSGTGWTFTGNAGIAANKSSLGNPDAPDGGQVAYLQGAGSSISFTATLPGGQVALVYNVAETDNKTADPALVISVDGNQVTTNGIYDFGNTFGLKGSKTFTVSAGNHTITIANQDTSTFFFDKIQVASVDAIYNSGLQPLSSVVSDFKLNSAYGLQDAGYEGGFTIGGDTPLDLQKQANLDPRAEQWEKDSITNFFQAGGALAMVFNSSGYSAYGVADPDVTHEDTPKLKGIDAMSQTLVPLVATPGTVISASTTTQINPNPDALGDNYERPSMGSDGYFLLNVAQAGTYSLSITTDPQGSTSGLPGQAFVQVNGQPQGGITDMPTSSTVSFGSVALLAGVNILHIHSVRGVFDPSHSSDPFYYQWHIVTINVTPGSVSGTPPATQTSTATPTSTATQTATATATPTPGNWTQCANEGGTCTFSGTKQVRYGANNTWAYQTATGSIICSNAIFGDPLPGVVKHCEVSSSDTSTPTPTATATSTPPASGWTLCANEGGTCTFSGTKQVRYGANNTWAYQTATGSIVCNNGTFGGDPLPNVVKHCDVASA